MKKFNPFEEHSDAILVAASEIYRAERAHVDPDPELSRVSVLPKNLDDLSWQSVMEAQVAEGKVNIAARAAARLACLQDTVESGGFSSLIARLEIGATRILERPYVRGALEPGGIVEMIRVPEHS